MLSKTEGLVLRYVKYGESSIIVTIYTDKFGLSAFVVNGVRSTKSKGKIAFYQPMSLLDLVVYHKEGREINRISEVKSLVPINSIRDDIRKSSIAIFLNEILNKCLKEESKNEILFHFLKESIIELEQLEKDFQNFHLIFLLKLSRYLGFEPMNAEDIATDISGVSLPLDQEHRIMLNQLLKSDYRNPPMVTKALRAEILEIIIQFYRSHLELPEVKSTVVLHAVLNQ